MSGKNPNLLVIIREKNERSSVNVEKMAADTKSVKRENLNRNSETTLTRTEKEGFVFTNNQNSAKKENYEVPDIKAEKVDSLKNTNSMNSENKVTTSENETGKFNNQYDIIGNKEKVHVEPEQQRHTFSKTNENKNYNIPIQSNLRKPANSTLDQLVNSLQKNVKEIPDNNEIVDSNSRKENVKLSNQSYLQTEQKPNNIDKGTDQIVAGNKSKNENYSTTLINDKKFEQKSENYVLPSKENSTINYKLVSATNTSNSVKNTVQDTKTTIPTSNNLQKALHEKDNGIVAITDNSQVIVKQKTNEINNSTFTSVLNPTLVQTKEHAPNVLNVKKEVASSLYQTTSNESGSRRSILTDARNIQRETTQASSLSIQNKEKSLGSQNDLTLQPSKNSETGANQMSKYDTITKATILNSRSEVISKNERSYIKDEKNSTSQQTHEQNIDPKSDIKINDIKFSNQKQEVRNDSGYKNQPSQINKPSNPQEYPFKVEINRNMDKVLRQEDNANSKKETVSSYIGIKQNALQTPNSLAQNDGIVKNPVTKDKQEIKNSYTSYPIDNKKEGDTALPEKTIPMASNEKVAINNLVRKNIQENYAENNSIKSSKINISEIKTNISNPIEPRILVKSDVVENTQNVIRDNSKQISIEPNLKMDIENEYNEKQISTFSENKTNLKSEKVIVSVKSDKAIQNEKNILNLKADNVSVQATEQKAVEAKSGDSTSNVPITKTNATTTQSELLSDKLNITESNLKVSYTETNFSRTSSPANPLPNTIQKPFTTQKDKNPITELKVNANDVETGKKVLNEKLITPESSTKTRFTDNDFTRTSAPANPQPNATQRSFTAQNEKNQISEQKVSTKEAESGKIINEKLTTPESSTKTSFTDNNLTKTSAPANPQPNATQRSFTTQNEKNQVFEQKASTKEAESGKIINEKLTTPESSTKTSFTDNNLTKTSAPANPQPNATQRSFTTQNEKNQVFEQKASTKEADSDKIIINEKLTTPESSTKTSLTDNNLTRTNSQASPMPNTVLKQLNNNIDKNQVPEQTAREYYRATTVIDKNEGYNLSTNGIKESYTAKVDQKIPFSSSEKSTDLKKEETVIAKNVNMASVPLKDKQNNIIEKENTILAAQKMPIFENDGNSVIKNENEKHTMNNSITKENVRIIPNLRQDNNSASIEDKNIQTASITETTIKTTDNKQHTNYQSVLSNKQETVKEATSSPTAKTDDPISNRYEEGKAATKQEPNDIKNEKTRVITDNNSNIETSNPVKLQDNERNLNSDKSEHKQNNTVQEPIRSGSQRTDQKSLPNPELSNLNTFIQKPIENKKFETTVNEIKKPFIEELAKENIKSNESIIGSQFSNEVPRKENRVNIPSQERITTAHSTNNEKNSESLSITSQTDKSNLNNESYNLYSNNKITTAKDATVSVAQELPYTNVEKLKGAMRMEAMLNANQNIASVEPDNYLSQLIADNPQAEIPVVIHFRDNQGNLISERFMLKNQIEDSLPSTSMQKNSQSSEPINSNPINTLQSKREATGTNLQQNSSQFNSGKNNEEQKESRFDERLATFTIPLNEKKIQPTEIKETIKNQMQTLKEQYDLIDRTVKSFSMESDGRQIAKVQTETSEWGKVETQVEKNGQDITVLFTTESQAQMNDLKNKMEDLKQHLEQQGYTNVDIQYHFNNQSFSQSSDERFVDTSTQSSRKSITNALSESEDASDNSKDYGYNTVEYIA